MIKHKYPGRSGSPKRKYRHGKTPDILLDHEITQLLITALNRSLRDHTLIWFALNTGLRNAEVVGLDVENVYQFDTIVSILKLPAEIAKGNKPRDIPIGNRTRENLDNFIIDEKSKGRIDGGESPLFRSMFSNKRLGTKDFHQILEKHSIKSLNQRLNPHKLRHTFATKLLAKSNIKIVQEILGHSSLQSTQIYLHPSSKEKANAIDKLDFDEKGKE